ncbi:MAG: hypothetical protein N3B15_03600 [Planctomycetota bacterium]|nr:hypothetical protein [Planctomycetota bacterium]
MPVEREELQRALAAQARDLATVSQLLAAIGERHRQLTAALAALLENEGLAAASAAAAPVPPPENAAPRAAIEALCSHLEALDRRLKSSAPGLDAADTAFLARARAVFEMPGADPTARALDILSFIDRLSGQLVAGGWGDCLRELARARALVQPLLPGYRLLQIDAPAADAVCRCLPVREPVIIATGLVAPDGTRLQAPAAIVPDLQPEPVLATAWALIDELGALLRQPFRKGLKEDLAYAVAEAQRLLASDSDAVAILRSVLNTHTRWTETLETPAVRRCLELLRARQQWRAYSIAPGERFDPDRHDLKRYDRIARSAPQPVGTVIGIRQAGLADANGLPVQKCLVIVSG